MEQNNPPPADKNQNVSKEEDLEFVVPRPAPGRGGQSGGPAPARGVLDIPAPQLSLPAEHHFPWKTMGIIAAAVAVLAVGGYYIYLTSSKDKTDGKEVNIIVPSVTPPVNTDTDKDGLTDSEEQKRGTKINSPDSDGDGLADGDEVFVYGTDPMLSDSDGDGYPDGQEPAAGYSPMKNTSEKATAEEIQNWTSRIAQYGLHEPTSSTLKLKAPVDPKAKSALYSNTIYKYSVELPPVLAYRENTEKNTVGIYVAGIIPDDDDLLSDPITITAAIKVGSSTLKELAGILFPEGSYGSLNESKVGNIDAIKITGVTGGDCKKDATVLGLEDSVIVISQSCSENKIFSELYNQVVGSFKAIQ